ncbi:MAG: phosphate regulon sensor protein PhoR [Pseudomonadota bacterium]
MSYDVRRFLFVISFSLFIGFIFNAYAVCLATGLILFYFWQYYQFKQLLIWLRKRHHTYGPEQSGFVDDICKEIEQIRERHSTREKKLSRFLNRFQKATGALPDAVIVLGLNGEIDWANKKAEEYLGIIWPKDSGLRIANLLRKNDLTNYINRENPSAQEIFNFKSPVNATLQLELRVSPYGDMQKLLVARDVSENLKINQMRKDFIANASHELRTPLTVVSGYLESFVDDDLCPPEWLAFIRQMRAQTTRMQTLIEDLLILSRLEANQDETEKDVVHVPNMINSIVNEAITLSGVMQHEIESGAKKIRSPGD